MPCMHRVCDLGPFYKTIAAMKQMKTLVVGDDPASNKLLKIWLESKANKVILADDGQEALRRLQKNTVDLIITDAKMPRLDGFYIYSPHTQ